VGPLDQGRQKDDVTVRVGATIGRSIKAIKIAPEMWYHHYPLPKSRNRDSSLADDGDTLRALYLDYRLKIAVTLRSLFILTEQDVFLPEHAPDQPLNTDPTAGLAISVTLAFWVNS